MDTTSFHGGRLEVLNVNADQIALGFLFDDGRPPLSMIIPVHDGHAHIFGAVRPLNPNTRVEPIFLPCQQFLNSGGFSMFERMLPPQWVPDVTQRQN